MPSSPFGHALVSDVAALWRANALTLASDLASLEVSLVLAQEHKTDLECITGEETTAFGKQDEPQADNSEDGGGPGLNKDAFVGLLGVSTKLAAREKETGSTNSEPDRPTVRSLPVRGPREPSGPEKRVSMLTDALEVALKEKTSAVAELRRTLIAADTLCAQLASLVQVLGSFDLKNLKKLRSGDENQEGANAVKDKAAGEWHKKERRIELRVTS